MGVTGYRDGSTVKHEGHRFSSQKSHGGSQSSVTPSPGCLTPSPGLWAPGTQYTDIHAGKHIKKNKSLKKEINVHLFLESMLLLSLKSIIVDQFPFLLQFKVILN